MSPRAGGEAAKFGTRFEGRWTVRTLLDPLFGQVERLTVEAVDEEAESVEFFAIVGGIEHGHQVKRQRGQSANWSMAILGSEGILTDAAAHIAAGRQFHFVSMLPALELEQLSDVARRSDGYAAFSAHLSALSRQLRLAFADLAAEWGGDEGAYERLRSVYAWKPDEKQLQSDNLRAAEWLFGGSPDAAVAVLGEIVLDNLGTPLTSEWLWAELKRRGVSRNPLYDDRTLTTLVGEQTERWLHSVKRELLVPPIERAESGEAVALLQASPEPLLVVGGAGFGKSAVVADVVERLRAAGWPVLAFRLDRYSDFHTPRQLGALLDLPGSPVLGLAVVAQGRPALLLCDQLDAVSLASGRSTEGFDVVDELLREAERFPNIRLLFACRQFDIDNDRRLRRLLDDNNRRRATALTVPPLDDTVVRSALAAMGRDPSRLTPSQLELLRSPLNLVLLSAATGAESALTFSTEHDLLSQYWQTKREQVRERRKPQDTRFDAVISRLVAAMNDSQRLAVPEAVLYPDGLDGDASVLVSEHVLVRDDRRYAFFHETLFDFAFARAWICDNRNVLEFLLGGEQELFRRAQVRQVLRLLRELEPVRFVEEVRALLAHPEVRYHIKDVVLALLRALPDPSSQELQLVLSLLESEERWRDRLELLLRTAPWFDRLYDDGLLAGWLAGSEPERERLAADVIGTAGGHRPDDVAGLLSPHHQHPQFPNWLLWTTRFIGVDKSRHLFELLLSAVRAGQLDSGSYGLWSSARSLGKSQPEWTVELLHAWLVERPAALTLENDRVVDLGDREYGLLKLVRESAEGAPLVFASTLLPYLQRVMEVASTGEESPLGDWHFGSRFWNPHLSQLDDVLLAATHTALRRVAEEEVVALRPLLEPLVDDQHQAAQDLLYEALRHSGAHYADWAGQLLLRGGPALESGYSDNPYWTTRQLLEATTPHMGEDLYNRLEALLLEYAPEWERKNLRFRGHASFTLLSAISAERLSEAGARRLAELQRKFERDEPEAPRGIFGGVVGSPIEMAGARLMSDENWLSAMRHYTSDRGDWSGMTLKGGAYELGHVLQELTKEEPERFARLALRVDASYHSTYLDSILMGLGETETAFDPNLVFDVIRHAAAVGGHDRWLGYGLKRLYRADIPPDIVELLVERAVTVNAADDAASEVANSHLEAINTVRGSSVSALAILLHAARG